jgi:DNA-binding NarL/FixJ family response regulator
MRETAVPTVLVGASRELRHGISRVLSRTNFQVVASASRIDEAVTALHRPEPCLLILDASDDHDSAANQVVLFRSQFPNARIVVLAARCRVQDPEAAYRIGAHGYFANVSTFDGLVKSLESIMQGNIVVSHPAS